MVVVGESEFVIVPAPETNVHDPVPTRGLLAAIVAEEETHTVCVGPALATVGGSLIVMVMFEVEDAHGEFEIDQVNTLVPAGVKPVTLVIGELGVVIVPGPEIFTQRPEPTATVLAAITAIGVETQMV